MGVPLIESEFTSSDLSLFAPENRKLEYEIGSIPAANSRVGGATSLLVAKPSSSFSA